MAENRLIGRPQEFKAPASITQASPFTNPLVRFRKIRGRVVPILGRKKAGQYLNEWSKTPLKVGGAGLAVVALGKTKNVGKPVRFIGRTAYSAIAKGAKPMKKWGDSLANKYAKKKYVGNPKLGKFRNLLGAGKLQAKKATVKTAWGTAKVASKAAKIAMKNPGFAFAGIALGGAAMKVMGLRLQAESPMGFDILPD